VAKDTTVAIGAELDVVVEIELADGAVAEDDVAVVIGAELDVGVGVELAKERRLEGRRCRSRGRRCGNVLVATAMAKVALARAASGFLSRVKEACAPYAH